ncbi:SMC-Scp complex subunit ScpB, partial [Patescibacteria group bacterium]
MIKSKIETILFISNRSISVKELSKIFSVGSDEIIKIMDEFMKEYNTENSGIHIIKHKGWMPKSAGFQMVTNPQNADLSRQFVKDEMSGELTRPSLETLSIIAYRGPVSKTEIEQIRGVNCSLILKNLLVRGLIEVKEDKEKMISIYNITAEFLKHLGVNDI